MRSPFATALFLALFDAGCGRTDAPPAQAETAAPAPTVGPLASLASGEGWNDAQIAWQPYDAGLAKAKAEGKPVCLVFFTTWCPHCKNYSQVFEDPRVVERARDFVMIRLNGDQVKEISAKYQPDGAYVPRTYFLSRDGVMDTEIHAPRPRFQYFYDEHEPGSLLAGMKAALAKYGR
jgi:thiol-disulfide isomerase/thioredoxin